MEDNKKSPPDDAWVVYEKTGKGAEEIQTRKHGLSQKLRSILIVIDGKATKGALLNEFAAMEGTAGALDELEHQGFIAKRADVLPPHTLSPEEEQRRVQLARTFMENTILYSAGPMGSSLVEELEKCETLEALRNHMEAYLKAITFGSGKSAAEDFKKELEKLIIP